MKLHPLSEDDICYTSLQTDVNEPLLLHFRVLGIFFFRHYIASFSMRCADDKWIVMAGNEISPQSMAPNTT